MTAGSAPRATMQPSGARFGVTRLYRDAASLASSYVVNATFGMLFWVVAARMVPPERLGVMTAVLAAITAPALVLAAGIGDAYTAMMPAAGSARPALYRRGQRVYLAASTLAGIVAAVATVSLVSDVHGSLVVAVLVAVGTILLTGFTLQNNTLVAIGRAGWMLPVNSGVGILRIGMLVAFATSVAWHSVELAFVLSAALVLLILRPVISRIIATNDGLPADGAVVTGEPTREFDRFVVRTFLAVALSLGMLAATPFLVTVFGGPREGALFALSLSIVQALDFVGTALGVSLVVHASSDPDSAEAMAKSILVKAFWLALAGSVVIVCAAPTVLRMLNPQYGELGATGVIAVLCVGSVIRTVYMVWAALQRSRRTMRALLLLNLCASVTLLATLPTLTDRQGAFGAALALLLAQTVLSVGATAHFVYTRARVKGHFHAH
ncbi:lipopolysaccharide biosynthesis protein [Mycolicibacterium pyrenivorans]|uniref:lipopolysaccharide biosynthesis protein n=1 Tax=Mycolicibacterium pyrenivorans TaxID=187102 RepID=UPI0021F28B89|nr:hypothetical protein [Mycolicibacterium pyrenivorans]MCV7152503.1 hypothetical protein [Mycolicibacterium pyrenivorans]